MPPTLAVTVLKARTGMTEVKENFKNMYTNLQCRKCDLCREDLNHILRCKTNLSEAEIKLVDESKNILDNIETASQSKVTALAQMINREMHKLKEIKPLVDELESKPPAPTHVVDTY